MSPLRRFGVLCLLSYVALSWAVRFDMRRGEQIASLLYPLDTFSMYASPAGRRVSYLLLRDGAGDVHRIASYSSFDCGEAFAGLPVACASDPVIGYHRDDFIQHIRSHPGTGGDPMDVVSRTWQLADGGEVKFESDCVVARCSVAP